NGCSAPQGPPGGGKDQGRSPIGGGDSCRKKVFDGIKSDLQSCVQQKIPGVQLPDMMPGGSGGDQHGMDGGDHHAMGGGSDHQGMGGGDHKGGMGGGQPQGWGQGNGRGPQGDPFDRMVNDSCKTDAAKASVKQCLQANKPPPPGGQGQQKPDFNAMKQQMCQAKQQCLQKLTLPCQQQLKDVKAAVCQCAKDNIAPKASQIDASLQACGGQQNGGPRDGPKGKTIGSIADRFQQMFCQNDAAC
uniref:Uncharacterized protein n=2 Tax=Romanomermis culicivorax TaxID=13658 RepID=A0A915KRR7_ROMCU